MKLIWLAAFCFLIGLRTNAELLPQFKPAEFGEQTLFYTNDSEVKILINAPADFSNQKKLKLIFYALPNGNSIEQTIGKKIKPGDDWHFNIQNIGAQTRFLRKRMKELNLVVVYLEANEKSWPTWRKKHADRPKLIPEIVSSIQDRFKGSATRTTLNGHSGGGSFIFGFINGMEKIPDDVERIAFLDSNYAYDSAQGHTTKLAQWLKSSGQHYLSVFAYHDAIALLDGKTFVSANGGTWGRSHAMIKDLEPIFKFTTTTNGLMKTYSALDGRVQFLLRENPDKAILHTVQVEKNGFIHSMLSGTPLEGKGYEYFGPRVYDDEQQN